MRNVGTINQTIIDRVSLLYCLLNLSEVVRGSRLCPQSHDGLIRLLHHPLKLGNNGLLIIQVTCPECVVFYDETEGPLNSVQTTPALDNGT